MHPGVDELQALAAHGAVTRHVLDCGFCAGLLRDLVSPEAGEAPPEALSLDPEGDPLPGEAAVLLRAFETVHREERLAASQRQEAQALFDELMLYPPELRTEGVENEPRFRTLAMAELTLAAAEEAAEIDPRRSHHLASLAVSILERYQETARSRSYHSAAYSLLADAERRQGRRDVAEDLLATAVHLLRDDPLDGEPRARLCRSLGELRREQGRVDEALALFTRSRWVAGQTLDTLEQARAALAEGWLLLDEYEVELAVAPLQEAAKAARDQQLRLAALHGLALALAELGREQELAESLDELDALRASLPNVRDQIRLDWILAQVDRRLGNKEASRERLEVASARFLAAGHSLDAAGVALELAHHELEKPEGPNPIRLLDLVKDLARSGGLAPHLGAVMEFALLFPMMKQKGYAYDVLRQASLYLQRAWQNPRLAFHPLPEPLFVFQWSQLSGAQRQQAAVAAGVNLNAAGSPTSLEDRRWISWTHEALTGVRIEFPEE